MAALPTKREILDRGKLMAAIETLAGDAAPDSMALRAAVLSQLKAALAEPAVRNQRSA